MVQEFSENFRPMVIASAEDRPDGVIVINETSMTKILEKFGEAIGVLENESSRKEWLKNMIENHIGKPADEALVNRADAAILETAGRKLEEMKSGDNGIQDFEVELSEDSLNKLKLYLYAKQLLSYGAYGIGHFIND